MRHRMSTGRQADSAEGARRASWRRIGVLLVAGLNYRLARWRFPSSQAAPVLTGLALASLIAAAARGLDVSLQRFWARAVPEPMLAVMAGLVLGNIFAPHSARFKAGTNVAGTVLLRIAIVLLGARLSFGQISSIGKDALLIIGAVMVATLIMAHALSRLLSVPARLATLLGVGISVCGNSAIMATAPVIGATSAQVAFAIAINTMLGTMAVLSYPWLGHAFGLSDTQFGLWAGTAVNDTSQVLATGFAFGQRAGEVAAVTKLARNAVMGIVIACVAFAYATLGQDDLKTRRGSIGQRIRQSVPLFVVGFLLLAAARTAGFFDWLADAFEVQVLPTLSDITNFLILVALAGIGLDARLHNLREMGLRPFAVAVMTTMAGSTISLLLSHLM